MFSRGWDTAWALEQARITAQFASTVKIIAEGTGPIDESGDAAGSNPKIELAPNTSVIDIRLTSDGHLKGIICETGGRQYPEDVEALFLAPPIPPDWSQAGGEELAKRLHSNGALGLAGLVNSIPYNAYAGLTRDGQREAAAFKPR